MEKLAQTTCGAYSIQARMSVGQYKHGPNVLTFDLVSISPLWCLLLTASDSAMHSASVENNYT